LLLQVQIVGKRGMDWLGDMAIDKVAVVPGACAQRDN